MVQFALPSAFEEFAGARKAGFLNVKAAKESGKKVAGCFCAFTPLEILDAAGLLTVSLCGMRLETIPAAETRLPRNLCPLMKSSYGFYPTDKCPYTYFADLIVGETTCDGKEKMYELLGQGNNTYILHLPQGVQIPTPAKCGRVAAVRSLSGRDFRCGDYRQKTAGSHRAA